MTKSTSLLLLDLGNSRLKWAIYPNTDSGSNATASVYLPVENLKKNQIKASWAGIQAIDAAYISAVGQKKIRQKCAALTEQMFGIPLQVIHTQAELNGLKNSYAKTRDLGVDRWLGLLAAKALSQGAAIVISLGTATTIDVVDRHGQHLGGYIVPGIQLMHQSLGAATADQNIQAVLDKQQDIQLAASTHGGIANGILQTQVALIERIYQQYQHIKPMLYLTGGAAEQILPFLTVPYQLELSLVFKGMQEHIKHNA